MSGPFSIGAIATLRVAPSGFQGWDYEGFTTSHRRLDDGTGSTNNEVLQSGSIPSRRAHVSGNFEDRTDKEQLQTYSQTKEQVTFIDDNGDPVTCVVIDLNVTQVWPGYWTFDMTLQESI
jgi:hypothetical protein